MGQRDETQRWTGSGTASTTLPETDEHTGASGMSLLDSMKRWSASLLGGNTPAGGSRPAQPPATRPQAPAQPQVVQGPPPHMAAAQAAAPAAPPADEAAPAPAAPVPGMEVAYADDGEHLVPAGVREAGEVALTDAYLGPERRQRERVGARPGIRALIVDDSPTIVAVLRRMLQQNGYQTYEAYTAEDALELARDLVPDLIFLDIVLPGMDGFAALRTLRRDPVTKAVPVIMISGNAQATEQFYVQRIGADDFMKKPFTRADVFDRIERLLDEEGVPRRTGMSIGATATATAAPANSSV
jgi:twitching motility two-component system response regulator PilH